MAKRSRLDVSPTDLILQEERSSKRAKEKKKQLQLCRVLEKKTKKQQQHLKWVNN